ncbi:hypothetical protein NQ318_021206 [Aromia moschata]|uniref:Uncharacterized protein n=1 Tax=Aromia moschata TaxID=1265417 RepID=A0AAV8XAC8_9CUCU|nr:hypothetical protein NQ318_021206 [Aromia moschata]
MTVKYVRHTCLGGYDQTYVTLSVKLSYGVCKLSNETGDVAPDLVTLRRRDLEGRAQVFQWFKAFLEGRESIEYEPRSGRHLQELMEIETSPVIAGAIIQPPAIHIMEIEYCMYLHSTT